MFMMYLLQKKHQITTKVDSFKLADLSLPRPQTLKIKLRRYKEFIIYKLFAPFRYLACSYLAKNNLVVVYGLHPALGDTLIMTSAIDSISKIYGYKAIVFSKFPEFFYNNPNVIKNLAYNKLGNTKRDILKFVCKYSRSNRVVCIGGESWTVGTMPWEPHIADYPMSSYATSYNPDSQLKFDLIPNVSPKIYFTDEEILQYKQKFNLPKKFFAIKASVGLTKNMNLSIDRHDSAMRKEFGVENMQYIIDKTPDVTWVQIGQKDEIELNGCIKLNGQSNIRETLYILSKAKAVLTIEGFINHAAAAFNTPAFTIFFGNKDDYKTLVYQNCIVIKAEQELECMPCWSDKCLLSEKLCLTGINKDKLIALLNAKNSDC